MFDAFHAQAAIIADSYFLYLTMKLTSILMLMMSMSLISLGQASDSKGDAKLTVAITGQLMVSGNKDNLFFNMGGGGLTLKIKTSAVSVNFLPSLRYNFVTAKITPILGFGPQWYIKNKFIIGVPFYYLEGKWNATFGIGYKLPVSKG